MPAADIVPIRAIAYRRIPLRTFMIQYRRSVQDDRTRQGYRAINDRIHIEKINGPFLSKAGCNATGPEFGAGIRWAIERGWLDLHESGTYVTLLQPGEGALAKG